MALPARLGVVERPQAFGDLQAEAGEALENLRDLAHGIYPPLLADRGLTAALNAQAARSAVPVTVDADGIGRFGQDTEAAVYFCCMEALQNAGKHAGDGATATVRALRGWYAGRACGPMMRSIASRKHS